MISSKKNLNKTNVAERAKETGKVYKIRKVMFKEHPILGNLSMDFCGQDGKAVDTVIIAGENGTGKSTMLNELYGAITRKFKYEMFLEIEDNDDIILMEFKRLSDTSYRVDVYDQDKNRLDFSNDTLKSIFSDVDINYGAHPVSSVTSLSLDENNNSRRSSSELPKEIHQLIIDIQAQDDASVANAVRQNPELTGNQLHIPQRMPRFTSAFEKIFDQLRYSHVENQNHHKEIIFQKNGVNLSIDGLSSGEKQIVYRGCFLLRDVNALNGPIVFIDEPELGLHPVWQMKIMDFYKHIFMDTCGVQTSQIFVATHSPFIIHNENRRNDKVIILTRNDSGNISVMDKPEYFKCDTIEAVQDAFAISCFDNLEPTVYLEGRTDEKYFKKAQEIYDYSYIPFKFSCVGYLNENHEDESAGQDFLSRGANFLISRHLTIKSVFLFDCDTHKGEKEQNNVYIRTMPEYENSKGMTAGIENALILDDIDVTPYYSESVRTGKYGENNTINKFNKMKFCDYLCSLDDEILKKVFQNLKKEIDKLIDIF